MKEEAYFKCCKKCDKECSDWKCCSEYKANLKIFLNNAKKILKLKKSKGV